MPTYYKPTTSPKQPQQQYSHQRDQKPSSWLGEFTHHRNNNSHNHPYGFIPIPVPWYALSGGLGYQPHSFPNLPPAGVFFASEQLGGNMSATGGNSGAAVGSDQQQQQGEASSESQDGSATGVNNGNKNPEPQHSVDEGECGALVQSTSRAVPLEPQTDYALRFLSRQLQEAITLCEGYIDEHEGNIEGVKLYLDIASRDRLWAGLLETKFKNDEGSKHLLRSLPFDLELAVRQALRAAQKENERTKKKMVTASSADQQDKLDRCEKRIHEIEILGLRCGRVTRLAGMALVNLGQCKKLMEEMTLMQQTIEAMCPTKTE